MTERVRLGTGVVNAGVWDPLSLAAEVATLDVMSEGRAVLGLGAGHTPTEWRATGREMPSAGRRVDRLGEVIDVVTRLLAGDEVSFAGVSVHVDAARLEAPRPVQGRVPLMVGGAGRRVLALAAERADIVGLTGFGATRADGHRHRVRWRHPEIDASVADLPAHPPREALVQHVEITDDGPAAARRLATAIEGLDPDVDLMDVPFVWIGTARQIADRLAHHRARWGIDRYVIRAGAMDAAERVMAASA